MRVQGAVLAGGGATRMGGVPKGLLEVGGRRVLDRVIDALVAALGSPPLLVANAPEATSWAPDLRLVPPGLLTALAEGLQGYDAFLPESTGPKGLEPLCAAYGPACRDAIAATLDSGDRRAVGFHDRVKVGILSLDRIRPLGDPERIFFNINTAEDLAEADARWHRPASSR